MIERVRTHFAQRLGECISSYELPVFYVYDPPGDQPCQHRSAAPEPQDLTVYNAGAAVVHLVALDHCLYGAADTARCDCALIRAEEIHFVEFKHGKNKCRSDRLRECIPQLAAAINDFVQAGIIAPRSAVRAVACVGFAEQHPPRGAAIEARILQLNKLVTADVAVDLYVADSTSFV